MQLDIRNAQGERLDHAWHPGASDDAPIVVLGHGVTANKDRPFLVALAEGLADAGLAALRVSFAGNGDSDGRFEDATVSKEAADLEAVLAALAGRRVAYVGHSMGAAVGLVVAARGAALEALVSLGGMVHVHEFARRKFGELTPGSDCMWDKPECPLSPEYIDDMRALDTLLPRASAVTAPWLLVHGTDDTVVLPADSRDAAARAGGEVLLVPLEGADHVFSGEATPAMVSIVVPWMAERLGAAR